VGVIELDRHLLREAIQIIVFAGKADNVMEGTSNKEVLLLEAEFPSWSVFGIENLRDVLGEGLSTTARGVVARVEYLKVELLAGPHSRGRSLLTVLLL